MFFNEKLMELEFKGIISFILEGFCRKRENAQLTRSVISGFGGCSQRAGAEIARRSGSVHCLLSSKQPSGHARRFADSVLHPACQVAKPVRVCPACQVAERKGIALPD